MPFYLDVHHNTNVSSQKDDVAHLSRRQILQAIGETAPETGKPEMDGAALPPEESQAENLLRQISVPPLAVIPKFSVKEQLSLSLGPRKVWILPCQRFALPLSSPSPIASRQ